MTKIPNLSTQKVEESIKNIKKLPIIFVFLVLIAFTGLFLFNSSNSVGKSSSTGFIQSISADAISEEVVSDTATTGYEEVEGYPKYITSCHPYYEEGLNGSVWGNEEGKPLCVEIISLKKEDHLILSIGYFDEEEKWKEEKKYVSEKALPNKNEESGVIYYDYVGFFRYPEDVENSELYNSEETLGGIFTIVENSPYGFGGFGINGSLYHYPPEVGSPHTDSEIVRVWID